MSARNTNHPDFDMGWAQIWAQFLEQTCDHCLTARPALLVVGIGILTLGLHFLPTAALLTTVLLASGMVVVASTNERKARLRLAEQLSGPHGQ
jgi:hypothetical protein